MSEAKVLDGVVLITGARKGIGRAIAEHYLGIGLQVVGCSRSRSDLEHPNYEHACLDVGDEQQVTEFVREVGKRSGIAAVINNAGIASMNHSSLMPAATAERMLRTNVLGTFLFCREASKRMQRSRRGSIINIASIAPAMKVEGEAMYAASKSAVITLTEILARELAPWGIRINAIAAPPIDTDLIRGVDREKIDRLIQRTALRRVASPKDMTEITDFLILQRPDMVTGQTFYLGGL